MQDTPTHFWEYRDVAFWLNVHTKRVKELVRDQLIPHLKLPTGEVLFDPDELATWVRQFRWPTAKGVARG
jgi:hypothetical protein